jgi:hypothetical protein
LPDNPIDKVDPEGKYPRSDLSDEENNKRRAKLTDGGAWASDAAFNNLSKQEGLILKRRSYQCAIELNCAGCDGTIHYRFKKFKTETIDFNTGQKKMEYEDYEWNTEFESIMLTNGATQNRINTPEGSKCECLFCHGRPGYDDWKRKQQLQDTAKMVIHKYDQNEMAPEERDKGV